MTAVARLRWPEALVVMLPLLIPLSAAQALSTPGALDPSFGGDGKVKTEFPSGAALASTVLVRPDGKIVAAGGAGDIRFAVAQYGPNGTLDMSFGAEGKATARFRAACTGEQTDAAFDAMGRVIVGGSTGCRHGRFAIARFMLDGTLDHSFGGDGKVVTAFGSRCGSRAFGVAVQSDGKIVLAGATGLRCPNVKFAVARYNEDGSLDTSFGGDGKLTADFTPHWDISSDVVVEPEGRIVAVGSAAVERDHARFALAAFLPNGRPDATFDEDGKLTTAFGECPSNGRTAELDPDGKILVGGWGRCFGKFALARYNEDGSLDASFGGDGKITTRFPVARCSDQINDLALQGDGKIVAAGYAVCAEGESAVFEFGIARYEPDGDLDTSLGDGGTVTTRFARRDALAHGVVIQSDGKTVAAGLAGTKFALARYLAD